MVEDPEIKTDEVNPQAHHALLLRQRAPPPERRRVVPRFLAPEKIPDSLQNSLQQPLRDFRPRKRVDPARIYLQSGLQLLQ